MKSMKISKLKILSCILVARDMIGAWGLLCFRHRI